MIAIEFWITFLLLIVSVHPRCNIDAIADDYRPRASDLQREHGADYQIALGYLLGDLRHELLTCEPFPYGARPGA